MRVYRDSSINIITTNTEWLNNWLYNFNSFNGTFFQEKIKKAISSISSVYGVWHYSRQDALLEFNHHYQIDQGFDIYKRKKDYVEIWAFSGKSDMPMFHDFCINNLSKLEEITNSCVALLARTDNLFLAEKAQISLNIDSNFNKSFLTPREMECARLIIIGETTKEIARNLNIAPKTVEVYINNIKQKTGCHYKHDLIKSYRNFL
jgi:DNA-binding CsgD family transcriptional regulator